MFKSVNTSKNIEKCALAHPIHGNNTESASSYSIQSLVVLFLESLNMVAREDLIRSASARAFL